MADYDIGAAFGRIENELISSMVCNLKNHKAQETAEGFKWAQWQVEQLKALEDYKKSNHKKFAGQFDTLNRKIKQIVRDYYNEGATSQEKKILQAIRRGYKPPNGTNKPPYTGKTKIEGEFFKVNERKLETLIKSTTNDMQKAETAVLRMSNDKYRKIIFDAQVYANAGGTTYEKAVDMAIRDFLSAGLNCVQYKNGARHTISDYAEMAIKTANKRAYLRGEATKREEWGIHTVIVNKRGNACPLCAPFCGQVFIDDVYGGGTSKDGNYPLLSSAVAAGFLHPRCQDSYTTYFEGISTPPSGEKLTQEDVDKINADYEQKQKKKTAEKQAERMDRLAKYSLDGGNQKMYSARAEQWRDRAEMLSEKQQKSVAKSTDSGIIKTDEMHRKGKTGKVEPMSKKQFRKLEKSFKKRGGLFQYDATTDKYLESKNAEAITYNATTILFKQNPGRASVFEELIHTHQYRSGKNDGSYASRLICEIEAQKKLINHSELFKLTEPEIEQTKRALKSYEAELKIYNKKGGK